MACLILEISIYKKPSTLCSIEWDAPNPDNNICFIFQILFLYLLACNTDEKNVLVPHHGIPVDVARNERSCQPIMNYQMLSVYHCMPLCFWGFYPLCSDGIFSYDLCGSCQSELFCWQRLKIVILICIQ
jgi:hypothetical protein